jgi:hypothetical protein
MWECGNVGMWGCENVEIRKENLKIYKWKEQGAWRTMLDAQCTVHRAHAGGNSKIVDSLPGCWILDPASDSRILRSDEGARRIYSLSQFFKIRVNL